MQQNTTQRLLRASIDKSAIDSFDCCAASRPNNEWMRGDRNIHGKAAVASSGGNGGDRGGRGGRQAGRQSVYRVGKILEFYEGGPDRCAATVNFQRTAFVIRGGRLFWAPDASRTNQWSRNWNSIDYIDNATPTPTPPAAGRPTPHR